MRHLQSTFNLVQDAQQCGGEILRGVRSASGAGASGLPGPQSRIVRADT
jgi:hypothetical protein